MGGGGEEGKRGGGESHSDTCGNPEGTIPDMDFRGS